MSKRLFDLVFSIIGLAVLLLPMLILALLVRLTSRGPSLFVQTRVGLGGCPFKMYKFRTMRLATGAELTVGQDPRITTIGRVLRLTKIDELPQLLNVFKGDMSFVGPRPEVEKYVANYSEPQRQVLELKPGITDPASFALFDESALLARASDPETFYVERLMPEKIRINLEYASKRTLARDLFLMIATVLRPLGCRIDVFSWLKLRPPQLEIS